MAEMSRISLMSCSSRLQFLRMMRVNSIFSSLSSMACSRSQKPTMAFSGVRISWVMLARNTLFCRPDSLALRVSSFSLSCLSMNRVMSRMSPKYPVIWPFSSYSGILLMAYQWILLSMTKRFITGTTLLWICCSVFPRSTSWYSWLSTWVCTLLMKSSKDIFRS